MQDAGSTTNADGVPSVLHVTTAPVSLRFLRGQVGYFKARGWKVDVLSAAGPELIRFGAEEGVSVHTAPLTRSIAPLQDLRALLSSARTIRRLKPDIVHAHTPKAGLLALLAATVRPGSKRVYQVRGLPFETATGFLRVLLRSAEWLSCGLADRVLCGSTSVQRVLLSHRLCATDKCKALLGGIGNGIDAQHLWNRADLGSPEVDALREQLRLPADALVVGYVGRLARDKGITELCDAWQLLRARHPSARLLLVGAPDARDPVPAEVLESLHTDETVHCAGRVADPRPYYALMDVLALPSYREGLPNVVLEAGAFELPVVATRSTGCIDAVQNSVTGMLVEPHSASALASALAAYLSNPDLRQAHGSAARARILRDFRPEPLWAALHDEYDGLLRARAPRKISALARRCFDLAFSAIALVLLAPLFLLLAVTVWSAIGAPILFRQTRAGLHGRPFTLHKFRTMRDLRDVDGRSLQPELRLTRVGRWLRSTSLDELPELWDVLRGRMSVIGPRPLLMDYLPLYNAEQARRQQVRPGLTGWAQVHGRNALSWDEKLADDVWYVDHASPGLDLHILLQTIPQVLTRQNITPRDRPIMERFHGSQA